MQLKIDDGLLAVKPGHLREPSRVVRNSGGKNMLTELAVNFCLITSAKIDKEMDELQGLITQII